MTGEAEATTWPPLERLEEALGHRFEERGLLEEALRHASYANEHEGMRSNDRLEFLGDAVVGLVVAQLLFEANTEWDEGELTRGLHRIVDRRGLSEMARRLDIAPHLRLGVTERHSGGEEKDSILADAMEALIGAIFLEAGLDPVRALVRREFTAWVESGSTVVPRDPKTRFQELVMARHGEFPSYTLLRDSGVEGDDERFTVAAIALGESLAQGVGRSKQAAEFAAAERALEALAAAAATDAASASAGGDDG